MQNAIVTIEEVKTLGEVFVKSGFFADARDASQAIVKILAGRELGFSPIASMTGVYIVKGKPAISANLIAARVKASGRYDYRVKEHDATKCAIEFFDIRNGARESLGISTFTIEDARKAGTQNLDKFPRNMLFARAMSNGARWFCPDAFCGVAPYTPDELGAQVEQDEDGEIKVIQPQDEKHYEQEKKTEKVTMEYLSELKEIRDVLKSRGVELRKIKPEEVDTRDKLQAVINEHNAILDALKAEQEKPIPY